MVVDLGLSALLRKPWRFLASVLKSSLIAGSGALFFFACTASRNPAPSPPSEMATRCRTCPPTSLRPASACVAHSRLFAMSNNDMANNGLSVASFDMPNNDMPNNGLSAASLIVNSQLLTELPKQALTPEVFLAPEPSSYAAWLDLLHRDYAPDLVQYIVSCALDPCERVKIPDDDRLARWRERFPDGFPGELGLCSGSYNEWADNRNVPQEKAWSAPRATNPTGATSACLQRVSACVLARVSATETRVPISPRGDGRDGKSLLPKVAVATQYRENHGTPIQSFKRCDEMCLWGDPTRRNCDWEPRYVGQCVRGPDPNTSGRGPDDNTSVRKVHLKLKHASHARIRVVKGIYGGDDTDPPPGAGPVTPPVFSHGQFVEFPTYYGGQMLKETNSGEVEFDCPDNGPLLRPAQSAAWALATAAAEPGTWPSDEVGRQSLRTGYYSVMLGSLTPGIALPSEADVEATTTPILEPSSLSEYDRYPADEEHVFSYREGGFYGTIFEWPPITQECPGKQCSSKQCSSELMLSGQQFACHSAIWTPRNAMLANRLCAGSTSQMPSCFVNIPTSCDLPWNSYPTQASCAPQVSTLAPQMPLHPTEYDTCVGTPSGSSSPLKFPSPFTTYLNHPCDLFASDLECLQFLDARLGVLKRTNAPLSKQPPRRSAGGGGSPPPTPAPVH